jgi:hypothetical protein
MDSDMTPAAEPAVTPATEPVVEPVVETAPAAEPAVAPVVETAPAAPSRPFIVGYPIMRYHPVHGAAEFADPNAYAQAGGDDGDWRFKTGGEADAARTGTEAALLQAKTLAARLAVHEAAGMPVVRNSVAAEESAATGYPEPGLS